MIDRTTILLIASILLSTPLALAHVPGASPVGIAGTPKSYCEDVWGDANVHEYGHPADGVTLFAETDGALGPCAYDPASPAFDGHFEWAQGGAFLVASDGDGTTYGATACGWPYPDHLFFPSIAVFDLALTPAGVPVAFTVAADTINNLPPVDPHAPNCGDLVTDVEGACVNACIPIFPPGLDGTYLVYVTGTQGHVVTF